MFKVAGEDNPADLMTKYLHYLQIKCRLDVMGIIGLTLDRSKDGPGELRGYAGGGATEQRGESLDAWEATSWNLGRRGLTRWYKKCFCSSSCLLDRVDTS